MIAPLLYADDLVITSEFLDGLLDKFHLWKGGLESKGFLVNMVYDFRSTAEHMVSTCVVFGGEELQVILSTVTAVPIGFTRDVVTSKAN